MRAILIIGNLSITRKPTADVTHVGIDGVRDAHRRRLKLRDDDRNNCQTGDTPTERRIRDEQLIVGHFERSAIIKKKFKNDVSNFITIDYLKMR